MAEGGLTTITHKEDVNISQKIDDLRAWLDSAQTTSAVLNDTGK